METEITIAELLRRIDDRTATMSARNGNRDLLRQCRVAIVHLASQVVPEHGERRSPAGIILP